MYSIPGCLPNQGIQGKVGERSYALKTSGKNQSIRLMLEIIREISMKMFMFLSSISRSPRMPKSSQEDTLCPKRDCWFSFCYDGNRSHFAEIDEILLK